MDTSSLLCELYGRIPPLAQRCIDDLDADDLTTSPAPGANTIAWLIWHLTRVQDHHVSELFGEEQTWIRENWAHRFGVTSDPSNTGYGHTAEEVASIRPEQPDVLVNYLTAVDQRTQVMLKNVTSAELDRIVDRRWDPPVSMGVRLISIADDSLQHVGQAAYLRGLLIG